ncbi:MAG TPA: hypothetical protein VGR32_07975 [Brevundimonas sp.]|jgi:enamine deaminase RidA (YjgF/YER057c/UK114 family)|uniref:hypothetical protein n=1 Tax=Brevundimonas sp. TaxID=1871086 RepID=UPI002DF4AA4E|nr:hypothetical protein [Brevundimonas sp.]
MIRALSLAAALAILPLSAASAQESPADPEASIEAAAEVFEARMEEFGERAELIAADETLSEDERETRIAALWLEYQPAVDAFTGVVSENAGLIAEQALAEVDVDALVADALSNADVDVMAMAGGFAANGAWASNDPEHMATYGLMADYAMSQVDDVEVDLSALEADLAALEVELAEMAQDDAD